MNHIVSATPEPETASLADGRQGEAELSPAQARWAVRLRLEQLLGTGVVSDADLTYLVSRIVSRSYSAGDVIVRQGVRADAMGLVAKGRVAYCDPHGGPASRFPAKGVATSVLLPGSTFGEAMLVTGKRFGATLRAASDAEVCFLRRSDFSAVADNYKTRSTDLDRRVPHWLLLLALALIIAAAVAGLAVGRPLLDELTRSTDLPGVTTKERGSAIPVQIVAPLGGAAQQLSPALPVRAVVTADGLVRAELWVDGVAVAARGSPEPMAVPWVVELGWHGARAGQHSLSIRAEQASGAVLASAPVTVTLVPTGELAFASNREGPYAIYTMQSDAEDLKRASPGPDAARQPAWRQDGALTWAATPLDGRATIRGVSATKSEGMQLYEGRNPAWSADGKLAYDSDVKGISQVFASLAPDGVPHQVTAEEVYAGQPTWSPDGTQLAYVAKREGNWDIWLVDLAGGEPRQLTDNPAMDWSPAWSPDGKRLAFVSPRSGSYQIHLIGVDGGGLQVLTDFVRGAESPAWSPGGEWLAFVAYTGAAVGVDAREIYLMRADGTYRVRLTKNMSDDTEPAWGGQPANGG